jgi:hypothetical protein
MRADLSLPLLFAALALVSNFHVASAQIPGFAGVPWGATLEDVRDAWPDDDPLLDPLEVPAPGGAISLQGYRDWVSGRGADMLFVVHPSLGLVQGVYSVTLSAAECETTFYQLVGEVSSEYGLEAEVQKKNTAGWMDFCGAVRFGLGEASARFRSEDGAGIEIRLRATDKVLDVIYSSPDAYVWQEQVDRERPRF